jgi:hypothetical protein
MVMARDLKKQGFMGTTTQASRVLWSVFGFDSTVNQDRFMLPCSTNERGTGCVAYVNGLRNLAGGGGFCILKREPEAQISEMAPMSIPDSPTSLDAPVPTVSGDLQSPDTPVAPKPTVPGGLKNPANSTSPSTDDLDDIEGGFEPDALCSLPAWDAGPSGNSSAPTDSMTPPNTPVTESPGATGPMNPPNSTATNSPGATDPLTPPDSPVADASDAPPSKTAPQSSTPPLRIRGVEWH